MDQDLGEDPRCGCGDRDPLDGRRQRQQLVVHEYCLEAIGNGREPGEDHPTRGKHCRRHHDHREIEKGKRRKDAAGDIDKPGDDDEIAGQLNGRLETRREAAYMDDEVEQRQPVGEQDQAVERSQLKNELGVDLDEQYAEKEGRDDNEPKPDEQPQGLR